MASLSLQLWQTTGALALDEIEQAHAAVGGTAPGRRYATQQINHAYAVLLPSQFQKFCRNLHSEAAVEFANAVAAPQLQAMMNLGLIRDRKLDRGNPNPGNIGSDFKRFGMTLWDDARRIDQRNARRKTLLEELNDWRNAIAHQDFSSPSLAGLVQLQLARVKSWRGACNALAEAFDDVVGSHLGSILGSPPW